MGVYIYMGISKATTQEQWEPVYEETLRLAEAFQLAETANKQIGDVEVHCLVRTCEREVSSPWSLRSDEALDSSDSPEERKSRLGWVACGDYETMSTAEPFCLRRMFFQYNQRLKGKSPDLL